MPAPGALHVVSLGIVTYIFYTVVASLLMRFSHARKARSLGCGQPFVQKNRYPLGIDNLLALLAADKEKRLPAHLMKRIREIGCFTYTQSIFGRNFLPSLQRT
jgi:hypothetical protein